MNRVAKERKATLSFLSFFIKMKKKKTKRVLYYFRVALIAVQEETDAVLYRARDF